MESRVVETKTPGEEAKIWQDSYLADTHSHRGSCVAGEEAHTPGRPPAALSTTTRSDSVYLDATQSEAPHTTPRRSSRSIGRGTEGEGQEPLPKRGIGHDSIKSSNAMRFAAKVWSGTDTATSYSTDQADTRNDTQEMEISDTWSWKSWNDRVLEEARMKGLRPPGST